MNKPPQPKQIFVGSEPEPELVLRSGTVTEWSSPAYDVLTKHNLLKDTFRVESCESLAREMRARLYNHWMLASTRSTYGMSHTVCRCRSACTHRQFNTFQELPLGMDYMLFSSVHAMPCLLEHGGGSRRLDPGNGGRTGWL